MNADLRYSSTAFSNLETWMGKVTKYLLEISLILYASH